MFFFFFLLVVVGRRGQAFSSNWPITTEVGQNWPVWQNYWEFEYTN